MFCEIFQRFRLDKTVAWSLKLCSNSIAVILQLIICLSVSIPLAPLHHHFKVNIYIRLFTSLKCMRYRPTEKLYLKNRFSSHQKMYRCKIPKRMSKAKFEERVSLVIQENLDDNYTRVPLSSKRAHVSQDSCENK